MDGILNINKPAGKTSYDVVAVVKRLSRVRRVGHAGTLDPAATGVLPVCLGQGTRVIEFLADAAKTYRAEIELGTITDTYDAAGTVIEKRDASDITLEKVETALGQFRGLIQQPPPMYSAVKHQGKPLYELARAGITIERKSRPAQIDSIEILDWQPPVVTIKVECGKGTYIRSLAYDLGQALGCGGTLKSLVRLSYGPFNVKDAISLPRLEEAFRHGYWTHYVYAIDAVLLHWNAMIVGEEKEKKIANGVTLPSTIDLSQTGDSTRARVYTLDGGFLSVLQFDPEKDQWQTNKVFPGSKPS